MPKKNKGIVQRKDLPAKAHYSQYKDNLRRDFWFSCAYCSITEIESHGQGFEIDHYMPQKHFPEEMNEYSNLFWACEKCNNLKSDHFPGKDGLPEEFSFVRIDEEDPQDHLELKGNQIEGTTTKGKFNVQVLDLNRKALIRLREIRRKLWEQKALVAHGMHELSRMRIDNLPPLLNFLKGKVLSLRDRAKENQLSFEEVLQELIKEIASSPILNEDPDAKKRVKERKDYLKGLKALIP